MQTDIASGATRPMRGDGRAPSGVAISGLVCVLKDTSVGLSMCILANCRVTKKIVSGGSHDFHIG